MLQRRERLKTFFQILQSIICDLFNTIYVIKGSNWIFRDPKSSRETCSKETSFWRTCFRWSIPESVIFLHQLRLRLRCFKEESAWSPIFKWPSPASVILSHLLRKYKGRIWFMRLRRKMKRNLFQRSEFLEPLAQVIHPIICDTSW